MTDNLRRSIPRPFRNDDFKLLRTGIYDEPLTHVYVNAAGDFAYLDPAPHLDYTNYTSRREKLKSEIASGETVTTKTTDSNTRKYRERYDKIEHHFAAGMVVLEIGANDAGFLAYVHGKVPSLALSCVEPDENSAMARDGYGWLTQWDSLNQVVKQSLDIVMAFHVLEHIHEPGEFLNSCRRVLKPDGLLIFEVPALTDPLLSLYRLKDYEDFYFQRQHPYYYTSQSLRRLFSAHDFDVREVIPFQRYGLENHLHWLREAKPGGNDVYGTVFHGVDKAYRTALETSAHFDTAIAIVGFDP